MRPKRQGNAVVRPTPQQRRDIRRDGGILFSKAHDRPVPPVSQEDTVMSSGELPSHSSVPSGPENSESPYVLTRKMLTVVWILISVVLSVVRRPDI
ncbi:hypothetical protein N0V85_008341 [Neurospora sp. IMI 360204]|nr:hypothetical protein N0V85_008341 [Neurospora sp. IMI 360204]